MLLIDPLLNPKCLSSLNRIKKSGYVSKGFRIIMANKNRDDSIFPPPYVHVCFFTCFFLCFKVDLVKHDQAMVQHEQIRKFVAGTVADNAPVIPISAVLKYNIDVVCEYIHCKIPIPGTSVPDKRA